MAKLRELKEQLDAGETIISNGFCGSYCAVSKDMKRKRVYTVYFDGEYTRYNGFNALLWLWGDGEDDMPSEMCGWKVEPPLTEEEASIQADFHEALKQEGVKGASNLLYKLTADKMVKEFERELFTTKEPRERKRLASHIQFMRDMYKKLASEESA